MQHRFKRTKTMKTIRDDLCNPLVIGLVVPFLGIVDVGRVASVNEHFYSHVRDRLLYEQKNSNYPLASSCRKDCIEVILRLDVVKVPPAFVATTHKDGTLCEIIYDPRVMDAFDSMGYVDKAVVIEEYGKKFKLFYDSLPKPALPFFARHYFHEILSKSQVPLAQAGSSHRSPGVGDGTCKNHVELVIDCVKERYYSINDGLLEIPLP